MLLRSWLVKPLVSITALGNVGVWPGADIRRARVGRARASLATSGRLINHIRLAGTRFGITSRLVENLPMHGLT